MEANCTKLTERILQLALEIIYLLTGEDKLVVKKTCGDGSVMVPLSSLTIPERKNNKKILEVTKKMIELLTGESGNWSDFNVFIKEEIKEEEEELECLEGHSDLQKDVMVESQPTLTSPDGSSNGNPPERCPRPLYSQDSKKEDLKTPHHDQTENWSDLNIIIKNEIQTEEDDVMEEWEYLEGQRDLHEDVMKGSQPALTSPDGSSNGNPPEICPHPLYSRDSTLEDLTDSPHHQGEKVDDLKLEVKEDKEVCVKANQLSVEESEIKATPSRKETSLNISRGGHNAWNTSEEHFICPPYYNEKDDGMAHHSPGVSLLTQYIHHRLDRMATSTDLFRSEGYSDKSHPVLPPVLPNVPSSFRRAGGSRDPLNPNESTSNHKVTERNNKFFSAKELLKEHRKAHTTRSLFFCQDCRKDYSLEIPLTLHQGTPDNKHLFTCLKCGKPFLNKRKRPVNHKVYHREKVFSCSECQKSFRCRSELVVHQRVHTGEKPFSCPECGKSFIQKSQLNIHRRVHAVDNPFACLECKKSFKKNYELIRHQRTHTGEKPFLCSECGKTFAMKWQLQTHHRVHTGEKPFSCSLCGESFTFPSQLLRHQKVHSDERPFSCPKCGQCFARKRMLSKHKKTHV